MASYTIELQFLLRGFSPFNEKPGLYASPLSLIESAREPFFKAVGDYKFQIWGDERDQAFKEEFEKAFLEYNLMREIGYQTPDAFILQLGSFLRRKMPIYCVHWRHILNEMYTTNTGTSTGNIQGNTTNSDFRNTDSEGKSNTDTHNVTDSTTEGSALAGMAETPQNELNLDLNNLKFASTVNKSDTESKSNSVADGNSLTTTEDHVRVVGGSTGNSVSDSLLNNEGRNKDVFDIYDQWIKSGYDLFTPLFEAAIREQLFCVFN